MTLAMSQPAADSLGSEANLTLVDRTAALRDRLTSLSKLRELATQAQQFQTRATELERATSALATWVIVLERFRTHGVPLPADLPETASVHKLASQMSSAFANDPQSIIPANPMLKKAFWEPLDGLPRQLAQALGTAWISYVESLAPAPQAELLDVLGALPAFRAQVGRIRGLYRALDELKRPEALLKAAQSGADSAAQLDVLLAWSESLPKEITTALSELTGEGIPADILSFIRLATAPTGAPFAQLTSSVRDWLEQHGLVESLRVRLGSSN